MIETMDVLPEPNNVVLKPRITPLRDSEGARKPDAELMSLSFFAVSTALREGRKYRKSLGEVSGNHRLRSRPEMASI